MLFIIKLKRQYRRIFKQKDLMRKIFLLILFNFFVYSLVFEIFR